MTIGCLILALWSGPSLEGLSQETAVREAKVSLALQDYQTGRVQSLEDFRGKIVILNFWATWCVPCAREMPVFVSIQKRYRGKGIQVIGASADEDSTRDQVGPFLERHRIDFPIWVGATTAHLEALGLGKALPATAIIDRQGQMMGRIKGPAEESQLVRYIEWLLAAPPEVIETFEKSAHEAEEDHAHEHEEKHHSHGDVGIEGASSVPS